MAKMARAYCITHGLIFARPVAEATDCSLSVFALAEKRGVSLGFRLHANTLIIRGYNLFISGPKDCFFASPTYRVSQKKTFLFPIKKVIKGSSS